MTQQNNTETQKEIYLRLIRDGLITPACRELRVDFDPLPLDGKSLSECLNEVRGEEWE